MPTNPAELPKPSGRVALVTGAARGIGAATTLALARRGIASAVLVRDADAASVVATAVAELGVACRVETCDVRDYAAVQRCVANILETWQRLDIVINNAGQIEPQAILGETEPAEWAGAISTNLIGPYNVVHAALPELVRRRGTVVNLSTRAAHEPRHGWSAYCSSKAGLQMLSRCILNEYSSQGLAVYSLQPGVVDTEMQVRIREKGLNEISRIPRENLLPPEHSAGVIAWLADTQPSDLMGSDLSSNDAVLVERSKL